MLRIEPTALADEDGADNEHQNRNLISSIWRERNQLAPLRSLTMGVMPDNSDQTIQRFVQTVLRLQKEREEELTQEQLREIAQEIGMSSDDLAYVQQQTQDRINRGTGFLRHRNWSGAIQELMEGATLAPSNTTIILSLAEAHFGRWGEEGEGDDREKARYYAERVLRTNSMSERAIAIVSAIDRNQRPGKAGTPQGGKRVLVLALAMGMMVIAIGVFFAIGSDRDEPTPLPPPPRPTPEEPVPEPPKPIDPPKPEEPPSFGTRLGAFGRKGSGAGMFTDARIVAADMKGRIYVSGYDKGIINVFDTAGVYLTQFKLDLSYVSDLAADHLGNLYVISGARIHRVNAETGEMLGEVRGAFGPGFTDIAILPDGSFIAPWDEYAKGGLFINQAPNDRFVLFSSSGKQKKAVKGLMSTALEGGASDVSIAVDGQGAIFATGRRSPTVCHFSSDWTYVDRWSEHVGGAQDIAVDGQGRVLVLDFEGVNVFDSSGRFLGTVRQRGGRGIAVTPRDELLVVSDTTVVRWALPH